MQIFCLAIFAFALAGCKGHDAPIPTEISSGADRLGTDVPPGVESVYGFALPRAAHIERQFSTTAYVRVSLDTDSFLRFLQHAGEPFKLSTDEANSSSHRRHIVISPFRLRANHDEYRLEWQQNGSEPTWVLKLDWVEGERRAQK
jgi:hypothetical protein